MLVLSFFFASACADELTPPTESEVSGEAESLTTHPALQQEITDVPSVEMDLPPSPRPWDTDPQALVPALEQNRGRASIAFKRPSQPRTLAATGPVVRAPVPASAIRNGIDFLMSEGVQIRSYYPAIGAVSVRISPERAPEIASSNLVDWVEPDRPFFLSGSGGRTGTDPAFRFAQTTPWGVTAVKAPEAWSRSDGNGATVFFIDSGHDRGHEDLPNLPVANCDSLGYGGCSDQDAGWHGTHVMGITAARNNSTGTLGVAPGLGASDIYMWDALPPGSGELSTESISEGIQKAIDLGVDVLSMSFSGKYNSTHDGLINNADAAGIVNVAAAGNHCYPHGSFGCSSDEGDAMEDRLHPGGYLKTIAVSGINEVQFLAHEPNTLECSGIGEQSNFHELIDLAAPWEAYSTEGNNTYGVQCGTSMAAPYVTGVVAIVRAMEPSFTASQVRFRLFDTAKDLGPPGHDTNFGYGLVDARAATGPHPTVIGPDEVQPNETCEWEVSVYGGYDNPGSLTYEWYRDGVPDGTNETYSTSFEEGEGHDDGVPISVVVTDGQGVEGEGDMNVVVDALADECGGHQGGS